MKKYTLTTIIFVFCYITSTWAQDAVQENNTKSNLRWGVDVGLRGSYIEMEFENNKLLHNYSLKRENSFSGGLFLETNKFEASIITNGYGFTASAGYNVFKKFWLNLQGAYEDYGYDAYIERGNNDYGNGYGNDINISQAQLGISYHDIFGKRFKFKAGLAGGILTGDKTVDSYVANDYSYEENNDNYFDYDYISNNTKRKVTDEFSVNTSLIFSAKAYLELLPNPKKNRKKPVTPFVEMTFFGSVPNAEAKRTVEEWIDGNVVYLDPIDYSSWSRSSFNIWLGAGIKWYFRY
ncbi:MAG: hypothetical protein ACK5IQ_10585 [Bacteroidales bacterium]